MCIIYTNNNYSLQSAAFALGGLSLIGVVLFRAGYTPTNFKYNCILL